MRKEIIILTKSIKVRGYCVAGIDANSGEWVRIVSDDVATEHAVLDSHMTYANGTLAEIFDVVQIDFVKKVATPIQPENWLFNEDAQWVKVGKSNLREVLELHPYENPEYIFYNTDKAITDSDIIPSIHSSLLLVKVPHSSVFIKTFEYKRFSLNFTYNNRRYQYISVTDEDIRSELKDCDDGSYLCRSNIPLVFSLTDKHKGKYYKIAAQLLSGM